MSYRLSWELPQYSGISLGYLNSEWKYAEGEAEPNLGPVSEMKHLGEKNVNEEYDSSVIGYKEFRGDGRRIIESIESKLLRKVVLDFSSGEKIHWVGERQSRDILYLYECQR